MPLDYFLTDEQSTEDEQDELIPNEEPFYANQMEDPKYAYYLFDIWIFCAI